MLFISGCVSSRAVEVPIPIPCKQPQNIPVPHDYMADLNAESNHADFIRACFATRESCFNAYHACAM